MAPWPALSGPTYESLCLIQACKACGWSERRGRVERVNCPHCHEALGPPVGLAFGGLSVELSHNHVNLAHGPHQWVRVEPADLPDVVRFLVRHARVTWEDRPETPLARNATERGFLILSAEWWSAARSALKGRELPEEAHRAALACLLIARERPGLLGVEARRAIQTNHGARMRSRHAYCESQVWNLCAGCLQDPPAARADLLPLVWLLEHTEPEVRARAMHMAWILRDRLDRKGLLRILFDRITGPPGAVEYAIGLLVALLGSERAFLLQAEAHRPSHLDQLGRYWQRIDEARARGPRSFQAVFERRELDLRRLIEDRCLG